MQDSGPPFGPRRGDRLRWCTESELEGLPVWTRQNDRNGLQKNQGRGGNFFLLVFRHVGAAAGERHGQNGLGRRRGAAEVVRPRKGRAVGVVGCEATDEGRAACPPACFRAEVPVPWPCTRHRGVRLSVPADPSAVQLLRVVERRAPKALPRICPSPDRDREGRQWTAVRRSAGREERGYNRTTQP